MLFEIILSLLTFWLMYDYLSKKRRNDMLNHYKVPGPKPLPIIGNALKFRGVNNETIFDFTKRNKSKYGKIYRFWVMHYLNLVVLDVKYLEPLLSSQTLISKSPLYEFIESWLGLGLLLSTGKKWHTRRKIITPAFHFKILEQFVEIFDQQSGVMVKKLHEQADGKTIINIFPVICLTALDIIAETSMGVKVHAQEQPDLEYVRALAYVGHVIGNRFVSPLQRTEWLFRLTQPKKHQEVNRCIKIMHDFTNKVIEERREALQKSIADGSYQPLTNDEVGAKKRMALLDVLLQSTVGGAPLSNEDIREEVDTFMFEGHDTTTSGISFCLYLISRHQEVQKKLYAEIKEVFGADKTRPAIYQDLQNLKYLECVIKESMRLYPPVAAIGRRATEDTQLGDITVPANTNITINFYSSLRDPDYFPDPEIFKPERFAAGNDDKINPFAYTPFSAGPRNCIGQKFAMLEMKSTISKILRHFELLPLGEPVKLILSLILRSVNGVNLGLKPRA